jgi:hypothetical protein
MANEVEAKTYPLTVHSSVYPLDTLVFLLPQDHVDALINTDVNGVTATPFNLMINEPETPDEYPAEDHVNYTVSPTRRVDVTELKVTVGLTIEKRDVEGVVSDVSKYK